MPLYPDKLSHGGMMVDDLHIPSMWHIDILTHFRMPSRMIYFVNPIVITTNDVSPSEILHYVLLTARQKSMWVKQHYW